MQLKKSKGPQLARAAGHQLKQATMPGVPAPAAAADIAAQGHAGRNAEADSLVEISEVLEGFRSRAARENQRFIDATDSEYWFAVCFQTRAQKEEFLQKLGLLAEGDKYLDGLAVARALGITIESPTPPIPRLKVDPKLNKLALPLRKK